MKKFTLFLAATLVAPCALHAMDSKQNTSEITTKTIPTTPKKLVPISTKTLACFSKLSSNSESTKNMPLADALSSLGDLYSSTARVDLNGAFAAILEKTPTDFAWMGGVIKLNQENLPLVAVSEKENPEEYQKSIILALQRLIIHPNQIPSLVEASKKLDAPKTLTELLNDSTSRVMYTAPLEAVVLGRYEEEINKNTPTTTLARDTSLVVTGIGVGVGACYYAKTIATKALALFNMLNGN